MTLETIVNKTPIRTPWWKRTLIAGAFIATTAIAAACGVVNSGKNNECTYDSQCPSSVLQCDDGLCHYIDGGELFCVDDFDCPPAENCDDNGCGSGRDANGNPPPIQGPTVLSPNTRILTEEYRNDLLEASAERLTFSAGSDYALGLNPGDIVVTGIQDQAPQGLLRRVSGIQNNGTEIEIATTSASLEEALQEASFTIPIEFSQDNSTIYAPLTSTETKQLPLTLYTLDINFDGTNLYQDVLMLDGNLQASIDSNLSVDIDWNTLKELRYTISGEEVLDVTLRGEISERLHKELPSFEPVNLPAFTFFLPTVPPFPIVITPNLSLTFGVDCAGQISAETSASQSLSLEFGLKYDNGNWEKIAETENNFSFNPPKLGTTEGELTVYATPNFSLELYDLAGPYVEVKGHLRGEAGYSEGIWYKIFAGLKVIAGVKVEAFGRTLADFSDTVYEHEELLDSYEGECSQNECDHEGQRICDSSNPTRDFVRECVDYNGDGCLEWSTIEGCSGGETCVNGNCVEEPPVCQDECSNEGQLSCSGNNVMGCETGGDGCLDQVIVRDCGSNEYCSSGNCVEEPPVCQDECSPEGNYCDGRVVMSCNRGSDGCLNLGIVEHCESDEYCSSGNCVEAEEFIDQGNGTILETGNGNIWQKTSYGSNISQVDADAYCQDSTTAGYNWRLPTLGELSELCLPGTSEYAISPLFDLPNNNQYWSSSEKDGSYYSFYLAYLNFACTSTSCYKYDECGDVICIKEN